MVVVPLLAAGCGNDEDSSSSRRASREGLFFVVRSPNATAYLLGTIHFGREDFYPLDEEIMDAFRQADAVVLELEVSNPDVVTGAAMQMQAAAQLPPGDSLARHVSPETMAVLREYVAMAAGGEANRAMSDLLQRRPWAVAAWVDSRTNAGVNLSFEQGVEKHLAREAAARNKRIIALETVEEQVDAFSGYPDAVQEAMLRAALERARGSRSNVERMAEAWESGDLEELGRLVREDYDYPGLEYVYRKFFLQRNARMADRLGRMLQAGGTYFVAVGAGHLAGEQGVPALLERAGFDVRRGYP